jgi:Spy/CpxP family protein refolding chaperone
MKRFLIYSSVTLLLVVSGLVVARADAPRWHRWHHPDPLGYISHELNLTDSQKSQVKSMWQAEKPNLSSLVREFRDEAKEMDTATAQGNLDQNRVQEIASRQGATVARLLVEKERFKANIYTTVLTPEQRTKADELQKRWQSRLDRMVSRFEQGSKQLATVHIDRALPARVGGPNEPFSQNLLNL